MVSLIEAKHEAIRVGVTLRCVAWRHAVRCNVVWRGESWGGEERSRQKVRRANAPAVASRLELWPVRYEASPENFVRPVTDRPLPYKTIWERYALLLVSNSTVVIDPKTESHQSNDFASESHTESHLKYAHFVLRLVQHGRESCVFRDANLDRVRVPHRRESVWKMRCMIVVLVVGGVGAGS
jgi:hypothetical protein